MLESELLFAPSPPSFSETKLERLVRVELLPRESVEYQPLPLNMIGRAWSWRFAGLPHFSQGCSDAEPKGSWISYLCPASQR